MSLFLWDNLIAVGKKSGGKTSYVYFDAHKYASKYEKYLVFSFLIMFGELHAQLC